MHTYYLQFDFNGNAQDEVLITEQNDKNAVWEAYLLIKHRLEYNLDGRTEYGLFRTEPEHANENDIMFRFNHVRHDCSNETNDWIDKILTNLPVSQRNIEAIIAQRRYTDESLTDSVVRVAYEILWDKLLQINDSRDNEFFMLLFHALHRYEIKQRNLYASVDDNQPHFFHVLIKPLNGQSFAIEELSHISNIFTHLHAFSSIINLSLDDFPGEYLTYSFMTYSRPQMIMKVHDIFKSQSIAGEFSAVIRSDNKIDMYEYITDVRQPGVRYLKHTPSVDDVTIVEKFIDTPFEFTMRLHYDMDL